MKQLKQKIICKMRSIVLILLLSISFFSISAQTDSIAYSVNGIAITKGQLQKDFNLYKQQFDTTISIDDFVDAQIKRKLIEEEAVKVKIDTSYAFKSDISSVKDALIKKYVRKPEVNFQKESESYKDRLKYQLEVNHVIVPFQKAELFPNDTLAYYNKALEQRKLAEKSGFKQFEKLNSSQSFGVVFDLEDYSGYMGWITPLMYSTSVDDLLFSLKPGEISMPIRTAKGYHIFQVTGKRPAQGDPTIEMVIFNFPSIPAPQKMIDSVRVVAQRTYNEILVKNNFSQICQEFLRSLMVADQDCPSIEVTLRSQLPYPIINAAFQLQTIGEVSKPILTDYGFALIRLKSKKPPLTEEQIDRIIGELFKKSEYKALKYKEMMSFYVDSIGVKINQPMYDSIMYVANKFYPTDSDFVTNLPIGKQPLITIRDSIDYSVSSFKDYFKFIQDIYVPIDLNSADIFTATVSSVIKYSLSSDIIKDAIYQYIFAAVQQELIFDVEANNPEFKKQYSTFKEDLLYTNFYKQMIWDIRKEDMAGLEETFAQNKYTLDKERWKGTIVFSNNSEFLKKLKKWNPNTSDKLLKTIEKENMLDQTDLMSGSWEKGENEYVDYCIFGEGEKPLSRSKYKEYIAIGEMINKPVDFRDVYEQVKADYLNKKEKEILKRLYENSEITRNQSIIDEIR